MEEPVPPILQVPGLKLIEMGVNERGAYLKFGAHRRRVREVTLYMLANQPVVWQYVYSMYDAATKTVVTYEGRYGDPAKDNRIDIQGA